MPEPIKLLDKANEIISLLSEIGSAGHAVIAAEIGVPRSSVYRLVDGLVAIGMVRVDDPHGQVRLSERWLRLAENAQRSFPKWQHVIDVLPAVAERTGQTSFLSIATPRDVACIAWSQASSLVVLSLRPGRRFPFHIGAAGRLLFAMSSPEVSEQRLAECSFAPLTDRSISTPTALLDDADRIRRNGWVLSDQDVNLGISAVGVPAISTDGAEIGCLSIAGLSQDINDAAGELAAALRSSVDGATAQP